ncbi:MAG: universal stress protein [Bacteroidota bacterium]|nr:universal stress protein [Bacteroidota bacterium]
MKTIIAPTDFSPVSLNAVNYAADLAVAMNLDLALLHICRLPLVFSEIPVPADSVKDLIKDAEERLVRLREDILERVKDRIKVSSEVRVGTVVTEIEDFSATLSPYAVVMGTQGGEAVARLIFGSNTIDAMKNLSWPLLVVPPDAKFKSIRKIGLACDLKKVVETAPVEELKTLVKQFGAELHVIHINREGGDQAYGPEIIEESGLLQEMLDELHPAYHFLNNVNIDEGLSEYAGKNDLDLVVIIPKKHNLVDKLFHKSHSKELLLHTHVPVMSVHE